MQGPKMREGRTFRLRPPDLGSPVALVQTPQPARPSSEDDANIAIVVDCGNAHLLDPRDVGRIGHWCRDRGTHTCRGRNSGRVIL